MQAKPKTVLAAPRCQTDEWSSTTVPAGTTPSLGLCLAKHRYYILFIKAVPNEEVPSLFHCGRHLHPVGICESCYQKHLPRSRLVQCLLYEGRNFHKLLLAGNRERKTMTKARIELKSYGAIEHV